MILIVVGEKNPINNAVPLVLAPGGTGPLGALTNATQQAVTENFTQHAQICVTLKSQHVLYSVTVVASIPMRKGKLNLHLYLLRR